MMLGCTKDIQRELASVSTKVHLINMAYKNIHKVVKTLEFDTSLCMLISEERDCIIIASHSQLDFYQLETFGHQYQHEFGCLQAKDANSMRIDEVNNKLKILTFDKKIILTVDIETRAFNGMLKHERTIHRWNFYDSIFFETAVCLPQFHNGHLRGSINI